VDDANYGVYNSYSNSVIRVLAWATHSMHRHYTCLTHSMHRHYTCLTHSMHWHYTCLNHTAADLLYPHVCHTRHINTIL
jgi:hypothetical protein